MKLHEITETKSIDQLEEGWKDWALAAGIGSMALGGGSAAYDAYKAKQAQKEPVVQTQQVQKGKVTAPSIAKTLIQQSTNKLEQALIKAADAAGIKDTELKQFLAQCAHETMNFTTLEEIGTDKYIMKKYDKKFAPKKAKILGNKHAGDGLRYKGRGYIQLTGRYNYAKAGEALGLPLEEKPELVERPDIAAKVAVWFWQQRVKPKVDDFSNVKRSTKPINPGMHGVESRQAHFDKYVDLATKDRSKNL